ncbi:hypothetical protein CDAR_527891 [Caerostris darwini]|uniref:Uncharacterized protein n=1 Tax=Caerostris darwini TaxID=1538125 RepID=A0AAV4S5H6_9ARAC|nr:hypothetical protein CDAR_527891 [Caerostris darwini]
MLEREKTDDTRIYQMHRCNWEKLCSSRHHGKSSLPAASLKTEPTVFRNHFLFKSLLYAAENPNFYCLSFRTRLTVQKWSPDERSIMSAYGTVPIPPPSRWSTGVPRRYRK